MNTQEAIIATDQTGAQPENKPLIDENWAASASHSDLYNARMSTDDKAIQNALAPYEHRAFTREAVQDSAVPIGAAIGLAAAIPGYQASKALGMEKSRSDPSLKQAVEGYKGIAEGLGNVIKKPWEEAWNSVKQAVGITPDVPVAPTANAPWDMQFGGQRKVDTTPKAAPVDVSNYLGKLATTESNNDPTAKAKTSSATGLYQFTAGTWNDMVNRLGLNYTLADRTDPAKAKVVAEALTQRNVQKATTDLGRAPTATETYMYHLLGNAKPFVTAPADQPASNYITKSAYNANKSLFEGKTVGDIMSKFKKKFD